MLYYALFEFTLILCMLIFIIYHNINNYVNADGSWNVGYCIFTGIVYILVLVALFFTTVLPNIKHYLIVKNGIKTKGKILSIEPLWYLNYRPKAKFTLEVLNVDDSTFTASVKVMMYSKKRLLNFEIGDWLNVFYDAKDHSKIAIVHPDISTPQLHLFSTKTNR